MSEAQNVSRPAKRLAGLILATATLSACAEGETFSFLQPKDNPAATEAEATASTRAPTKLIERDVEAPDVFSATEAGLWDGRPSLGGVWVAHPDVDEPERVTIRNTANGKSVIGALFRRERDIPGPRIQASSDAATALGMLAGAPVQLSVIALRREEVAPEPETPAPETVETVPETTEVAETTLDPIAGAEAAIDAAGAETASVGEAAAAEEPIIEEPAPKKTWFGQKLFGRKKVDDAPLDAIGATTAAATDIAATELPAATAAAPAAAPVAAPKPKPKKSSLDKPFIQIGIFSVESNANRTADQVRRSGVIPTVYEQSSNGKKFWRVVVGPAQSKSERATLLKKVKDTGFSDAYAVTN